MNNRGGARPGSGRPKNPNKRVTVQIVLTPENAAHLNSLGKLKHDYLNALIGKDRGDEYADF
jgi:hypothetical protein